MNNKLHIISFDIPYPANYGGVMDVYHKLRHLHSLGLEIYLHCFQYGNRSISPELETICKQVYYYNRSIGLKGLHHKLPYIVSSRINKQLLKNLCVIEAPILFEGLHTCYYLNHPDLASRFKMVRTHNIEHEYYDQLMQKTSSPFSKLYFSIESKRLKKYEPILSHAQAILPISSSDFQYFSSTYTAADTKYVPAFHKSDTIKSISGVGRYCLYHGSLDVAENIEAAFFLCKKIWNDNIQIPLIIAGKNPSPELQSLHSENIRIVPNPTEEKMQGLIQDAQIILLPTFQRSGLKLKLLDSLFNGRHVICNQNMLFGTNLNSVVEIAETDNDFKQTIQKLQYEPFLNEFIEKRKEALLEYHNAKNAQKIINILR